MLSRNDKSIRQSAEAELNLKKLNKENQWINQYTIDGQLSDNNKRMLQAFKQNSGYYNTSPRKQRKSQAKIQKKQQNIEVPRIYLFGNDNGNYLKKKPRSPQHSDQQDFQEDMETKTIPYSGSQIKNKSEMINLTNTNKISQNISNMDKNSVQSICLGYEQFLTQVFVTLGLLPQYNKLQFIDAIAQAQRRFIDMKSNGRWELIQKYFKGSDSDDLHLSSTGKNILKKRSQIQPQRKKSKANEMQSSTQLIRSRDKAYQDLTQALEKLTKGYSMKFFTVNKILDITVYLSYNLNAIAFKQGKKTSVQSMIGYNGIMDGARSKNFLLYKRYTKEELCFSVVFNDRTLDFMARNLKQKIDFIQSLKLAMSFL